ncbi:hypothetical protein BJ085DRAFT_37979 [Dimargaris cristalligena]|uniref:Uncharacterized protein n=1 Tax=Dimargaris cristalligena TaxID=215637 RepID=A0A4Q0A176_9FUNG|nr:hypothetical protein BJ085DRAFT_37979 [Dimargaris cristalligena]|eukprot:RKP39201.1 hypothetical protein BJ085DRAFT_37979 [Dimargaris cristalligena]
MFPGSTNPTGKAKYDPGVEPFVAGNTDDYPFSSQPGMLSPVDPSQTTTSAGLGGNEYFEDAGSYLFGEQMSGNGLGYDGSLLNEMGYTRDPAIKSENDHTQKLMLLTQPFKLTSDSNGDDKSVLNMDVSANSDSNMNEADESNGGYLGLNSSQSGYGQGETDHTTLDGRWNDYDDNFADNLGLDPKIYNFNAKPDNVITEIGTKRGGSTPDHDDQPQPKRPSVGQQLEGYSLPLSYAPGPTDGESVFHGGETDHAATDNRWNAYDEAFKDNLGFDPELFNSNMENDGATMGSETKSGLPIPDHGQPRPIRPRTGQQPGGSSREFQFVSEYPYTHQNQQARAGDSTNQSYSFVNSNGEPI